MEDALNTGSWPQPNTFMDIIGPAAKKYSPRSAPERSSTLMRKSVKRPETMAEAVVENEQPVESSSHDLYQASSLTDQSPLISRFTPGAMSIEDTPYEEDQMSTQAEEQIASSEPIELAVQQPSFNIFNNSIPTTFEYSRPIPKTSKWSGLKRLSGWSVLGVVLIGVIAGGILINRNLGRFEFYMASSRAGFSATLPSVKPSGYGLGSISTASGMIEASFKSNVGNGSYLLNEKKSSVTSLSLLDGYVENRAGMNFQTVTTAKNTIYIFGTHNATWVNNGIWYVIQDNNSLSDHQIISMADSM